MAFLTKIQIGSTLYDLKDAAARADLAQLGLDLDALEKSFGEHVAANEASFAAATKALEDHAAANVKSFEDAAAATAQALTDAKAYTDAQIGAIKHFDVYVMAEGEELPAASADTMFVLYLKPDNAEAGAYVEYITIRKDEGYDWEQIGSTVTSLTNYATVAYVDGEIDKVEKAIADHAAENTESFKGVNEAIADANEAIGGVADDLSALEESLGALATKDEVSIVVPAHTVSGQKATGSATAATTLSTEAKTREISVSGSTVAAGNVSGSTIAKGSVAVQLNNEEAAANIGRGDYTPAGSVAGNLTNATFNAVKSAGTAASFVEGTFTPATLGYEAATCSYVDNAFIASVDETNEILTLTAVEPKSFAASKINSFNGGSKAADVFTANVPAAIEAHTVGMSDLVFTGTRETGLKVTSVSYDKAISAPATFTGESAEISATFTGVASDVTANGSFADEIVTGATTTVDALSLDVSSVTIESVTVKGN